MERYIRIGVYAVTVAALLVLLVLGQIDEVQLNSAVDQIGQLLGIAAGGVALANLTPKNTMRVPVEFVPPVATRPDRAPWLDPDE